MDDKNLEEYINLFIEVANQIEIEEGLWPSILPLISHEIGHLSSNETSTFYEGTEEISSSLFKRFQRGKEDKADEYSRRVVEKFISEVSNEETSMKTLAQVQAIISFAKYMQSKFLVDSFTGFRGLDADDLIIDLWHDSCENAPKNRRFDDIEWVVSAGHPRMPLFTEEEFTNIRTKLNDPSKATHAHLVDRAFLLLKSIDIYDTQARNVITLIDLVQALKKNDPSGLLNFDSNISSIGLKRKELLNFLEDDFSVSTFSYMY